MRRAFMLGVARALAVLLSAAGLTSGCRKPGPTVDTEPFKAAIHEYLQDHHMGLRVAEFREVKAEAQAAEATVAMEQADGMVGVRVRWVFTFRKQSGRWVATSHKDAK